MTPIRRLLSLIAVLLLSALAVTGASYSGQGVSAPSVQGHPADLAFPPPAPAEQVQVPDRSAVTMVIDLSGSMRGDRLQSAKDAVIGVLTDYDGRAAIGVWGYPLLGGCSQGDWVVTPPRNGEPLRSSLASDVAAVQSLTASGSTPSGDALRSAIEGMEGLGYTSGTVVLVSDGLSNCHSPPCPVADEFANSDFNITVHTVGYHQSDAGREELQCTAQTTGGRYLDAESSEELRDALAELAQAEAEITLDYQEHVPSGGATTITATVRNPNTFPLEDVRLNLAFRDAGENSLFPPVLPPTVSKGNIPPGESVTASWSVSTGQIHQQYDAALRVTAYGPEMFSFAEGQFIAMPNPAEDGVRPGTVSEILASASPSRPIVVVGDSFSSGEGSGQYGHHDAGSDTYPLGQPSDACHRSPRTYLLPDYRTDLAEGRLVSTVERIITGGDEAQLEVEQDRMELERRYRLMACSGAQTRHIHHLPQNEDPESSRPRPIAGSTQLAQLSSASGTPSAVFMTMGGNDVGFDDLVKCVLTAPLELTGTELPCHLLLDQVPESLAGIRGSLAASYREVWWTVNNEQSLTARDGEHAPVVVLPYPQLLHNSPMICRFDPDSMLGGSTIAHPDRIRYGNQLVYALNAEVRAAVEMVRQEGLEVYYAAPVQEAFLPDNTLCSGSDTYVRPINVPAAVGDQIAGWTGLDRVGEASQDILRYFRPEADALRITQEAQEFIHPNYQGYQRITQVLEAWMVSEPRIDADPTGIESAYSQNEQLLNQIRLRPLFDRSFINLDDAAIAAWEIGETVVEGTSAQLRRNAELTIQRWQGLPGTRVWVGLRSEPVTLGTMMTDEDGVASGTFWIPEWVEPGDHTLYVTGLDPDGEFQQLAIPIRVTDPVPDSVLYAMLGAAAAVVLAMAMLLISAVRALRRRRAKKRVVTHRSAAG
ncbi:VWA domain-containing protein [Nesterenkonia ebinurensis]|uniref:VWA domain-containing protein n=1 Tax=Nesterenkonia ebinurensis TaxID=2608252 RepID=UPI00168BBC05|nr:VWA domain-containing protein [Nesterenkonia ebinurensis]